MFCRLKDFRRIAPRYDEHIDMFLPAILLATAITWWINRVRTLEHYPVLWDHLTGIILSRGQERLEMRCRASDEKRDAGTGPKNPAFGGPERLIGCVAALARCPASRPARRACPNEPLWPIK